MERLLRIAVVVALAVAAAEAEAEAGEYLGTLFLDGLKRVRVESEQLQDRGSDLGRFHRRAGLPGPDGARRIDDERNVAVARVGAAVLGDLRATRVDGADLRDPEHVGVVRVGVRDAEVL